MAPLHLKEGYTLWRKSQGSVQKLAGWQVHVQLCLREIHWSISVKGTAHHFSQPKWYTGTQERQCILVRVSTEWNMNLWIKELTHFETSLSACRDFSRRANMRIWKTSRKKKGSITLIKTDTCTVLALCIKSSSQRRGSYQFCDHDWPKRCKVLGWNPQQENTKH